MTVDDLISQLAKPTMVYRFARADIRIHSGAQKRMANAEWDIRQTVAKFAHSQGWIDNKMLASIARTERNK